MMLKIVRAADLPAPGIAIVEVFACDLSHGDGRRATRNMAGKRVLQRLLSLGVRFVAITVGAGGRAIVTYTEAEFMELGADLIEFTAHAACPIVVSPCGLSAELNRRLIDRAQCRDLETVQISSRA